MGKNIILAFAATAALALAVGSAIGAGSTHRSGAAKVGEPAPSWSMKDTNGQTRTLADYAGKYVVLEWTNNHCPYVQKQYRTGAMQKTQEFAVAHGAVWLTVVTSAPGGPAYVTPERGNAIMKAEKSHATAELLDTDGTLGHEYGAKTTPDMFIVNPQGVLIYSGAIDNKPTTDDEDIKTATNYVKQALEEATSGKAVSIPTSQPYGCGIKYSN